jgi:hypothetical protein
MSRAKNDHKWRKNEPNRAINEPNRAINEQNSAKNWEKKKSGQKKGPKKKSHYWSKMSQKWANVPKMTINKPNMVQKWLKTSQNESQKAHQAPKTCARKFFFFFFVSKINCFFVPKSIKIIPNHPQKQKKTGGESQYPK